MVDQERRRCLFVSFHVYVNISFSLCIVINSKLYEDYFNKLPNKGIKKCFNRKKYKSQNSVSFINVQEQNSRCITTQHIFITASCANEACSKGRKCIARTEWNIDQQLCQHTAFSATFIIHSNKFTSNKHKNTCACIQWYHNVIEMFLGVHSSRQYLPTEFS